MRSPTSRPGRTACETARHCGYASHALVALGLPGRPALGAQGALSRASPSWAKASHRVQEVHPVGLWVPPLRSYARPSSRQTGRCRRSPSRSRVCCSCNLHTQASPRTRARELRVGVQRVDNLSSSRVDLPGIAIYDAVEIHNEKRIVFAEYEAYGVDLTALICTPGFFEGCPVLWVGFVSLDDR